MLASIEDQVGMSLPEISAWDWHFHGDLRPDSFDIIIRVLHFCCCRLNG